MFRKTISVRNRAQLFEDVSRVLAGAAQVLRSGASVQHTQVVRCSSNFLKNNAPIRVPGVHTEDMPASTSTSSTPMSASNTGPNVNTDTSVSTQAKSATSAAAAATAATAAASNRMTSTIHASQTDKNLSSAAAMNATMDMPASTKSHGFRFQAKKKEFNPTERRVPASPIGRIIGFGSLAASLAVGSVADAAKRVFQPGAQPIAKRTNADFEPAPSFAQSASNDWNARHPSSSSSSSSSRSSSSASTGSGSKPSSSSSSSSSSSKVSREPAANFVNSFFSEANAERLAAGLCRMRGAALKVGQMLSIQDDSVIPPQLARILERVRDSADVMPQHQLATVLRTELGEDWESKFKSFEMKPMAAASIGQVHRAVLLDGREVALKIQYPGVASSIRSDIANLKRMLALMDVLPRGIYLDESLRSAADELELECDYLQEAQHQRNFRELLKNEPGISVPEVIDHLTTNRVLCTELVHDVIPIDQLADLDSQESVPGSAQALRNGVAERLLRLCMRELFEWRYMQTDPNWSNFLYNPETDTVWLVDFGASRRYSHTFVNDYLKMVHACAERDRQTVIDTGISMGFLTGDESQTMFDAHVEAGFVVGEPFASQGPYDFVKGRISHRIGALAKTMLTHRLTPPPKEAYTLHRKLSGAFLSCQRLHATIDCRAAFLDLYNNYPNLPLEPIGDVKLPGPSDHPQE
jgi:aarF domain-containing kinase